ncbi:MAG: ATP phosphoribosyltransferase regulatory subunit [Alphaproteobacteria bacterium]
MTKAPKKTSAAAGLLPEGLRDLLPPDADHEASIEAALMALFGQHGYERVAPPLVEFEESLASGMSAAVLRQSFRVMDPISQRMMAVRADMTPQIGRIAATRLAKMPAPLRLSYSGSVLRVRGSQLRPQREFRQVGVELIGSSAIAADAEVMLMAAAALRSIGLADLTMDLTMPPLVQALFDADGMDEDLAGRLRAALDRKDAPAVEAIGGRMGGTLAALLAGAGPYASCAACLRAIDLPGPAAQARDRLLGVADAVTKSLPDLRVSIDPVENRGFEYHTGVTFTLFARGVRAELGTGGRYVVDVPGAKEQLPATGFTLFLDSLRRAAPPPPVRRRVYVGSDVAEAEAGRLREQGFVTVRGLDGGGHDLAEARRLRCTHVWCAGKAVEIDEHRGS